MEKSLNLQKTDDHSYTLDVKGLTCPYPQIMVLRTLKNLLSGDILEVVLDNPPSATDIPIALKNKGYTQVDVLKISKDLWKIVIRT